MGGATAMVSYGGEKVFWRLLLEEYCLKSARLYFVVVNVCCPSPVIIVWPARPFVGWGKGLVALRALSCVGGIQ